MGNVDEDVRVMTRKSVDDPGEPPGIVLSAATSVWLLVSNQRLFDFLRDERLRSEWDILSNGGPMQEMSYIAKGQDHGNCISLLRASAMNSNQSSMMILHETCIDAVGSLVVYAPVDIPAMLVVMNGGDLCLICTSVVCFICTSHEQLRFSRARDHLSIHKLQVHISLFIVAHMGMILIGDHSFGDIPSPKWQRERVVVNEATEDSFVEVYHHAVPGEKQPCTVDVHRGVGVV
ncbi:homeobox-leucine zipper protein ANTHOCYANINLESS 2-like [Hibiscus syriacus]|uniref:homeobox-leucine zipper protein ANTHOCYANINLESS 2-like n=1 Tax=Hibiscus syriacus TaxID=106335 RepID=UPI001921AB01|nr:homeobox-leucine zipper protein ANTHOCYANINLESS 2-like [Hibiscus syriacus]